MNKFKKIIAGALVFAMMLTGCTSGTENKATTLDTAGTYNGEYSDVVVKAADTVLENVTADKIVIDKEVGDGDVTLKNVTVDTLEVYGGGRNSVTLYNSKVGKLISDKQVVEGSTDTQVRVVLDEGTHIEDAASTSTIIFVRKASIGVGDVTANANTQVIIEEDAVAGNINVADSTASAEISGEVAAIEVSAPNAGVKLSETSNVLTLKVAETAIAAKAEIAGTVGTVEVAGANTEVNVVETAEITEVNVAENAAEVSVSVGGSVANLKVKAPKAAVKVDKAGSVSKLVVTENAGETKVDVDGTVGTVATQAPVEVSGNGSVDTVVQEEANLVSSAQGSTATSGAETKVEAVNPEESVPAPTTAPTPAPTVAPTTKPAPAPTTAPTVAPVVEPTKKPHEHKYTSRITKEATCTDKGVVTYTCSCGKTYTESISAKGHEFGEDGFCVNTGCTVNMFEAGGTVTLTTDLRAPINANGTAGKATPIYTISKDTTVNLNGKTISLARTSDTVTGIPIVFYVKDGATLTISNGTIDVEAGNAGAYSMMAADGNIVIESGTYTGGPSAVQVTKGELTINGGEFDLTDSCKAADATLARYLINCKDANITNGTASIIVNGGTFVNTNPGEAHGEPTDPFNYLATGKAVYATKVGNDVAYTVVNETDIPETYVAKIGNTYYKLEDAAAVGGPIELVKDVTLTSDLDVKGTIVTNKTLTLDLAGHKIYNSTDIIDEPNKYWSLISVRDGKLTITGDGEVAAKSGDCYAVDVYGTGAEVIIENGKFNGNMVAIYAHTGKVTINGGTFAIQQLSPYDDHRYTLNCLDKNGASIVVNGGIFKNYNPEKSLSENPQANFCAEGKTAVKVDDNYEVVAKVACEAKIGDTYYLTLADAAKAAVKGQKIELVKDAKLTSDVEIKAPIVVTNPVTLDLDGYKIYNTAGNGIWKDDDPKVPSPDDVWALVITKADLTIKGNGRIESFDQDAYAVHVKENGAKCTIVDGTFIGNLSAVYVHEGSLEVLGGTFDLNQKYGTNPYRELINCYDSDFTSGKAKVSIKGGTFKGYNPADVICETVTPLSHIAEGFVSYADGDKYTVVAENAVPATHSAKVGNTYYTLADAAKAAVKGQKIELVKDTKLTSNVEIKAPIVVTNPVTLDLAGHKIYNTAGNDIWNDENTEVPSEDDVWALVTAKANLTIEGNGTIESASGDAYAVHVKASDSTCTIENGTFNGNVSAVYVHEGSLVIKGGTFKIQQLHNTLGHKLMINCYDIDYPAKSNVTIYGGTFEGFDPANNPEGDGTTYLAQGYVTVNNDGKFVVTSAPVATVEATSAEPALAVAAAPVVEEVVVEETVTEEVVEETVVEEVVETPVEEVETLEEPVAE